MNLARGGFSPSVPAGGPGSFVPPQHKVRLHVCGEQSGNHKCRDSENSVLRHFADRSGGSHLQELSISRVHQRRPVEAFC